MNILRILSKLTGRSQEDIIVDGILLIQEIYEQHRTCGVQIQDQFHELSNQDILSSSISLHEEVPEKFRSKIKGYRAEVRQAIESVALDLEHARAKDAEAALEGSLPKLQERRGKEVVLAQKQVRASYTVITETLSFMAKSNAQLTEKIKTCEPSQKLDLLLLNALIICELSDLVIEIITDFRVNGKEKLEKIYSQVQKEISAAEIRNRQLWDKASGGTEMDIEVRNSINERFKIYQAVYDQWDRVWKQVDQIEANIDKSKSYLRNLELIRDNAREQMCVLEVAGITQIVQSNLDSFETMCGFRELKLSPLTKDDVVRLVGGS